MSVNPFLNRSAIRNDAEFFGRVSELKRIFNRIGGAQPQSVSIVGDRRIGKSSLLRAVMKRRATFLPRTDAYVFAYLDMQSRLRWTPEMFFDRLVDELDAVVPAGIEKPAPTYDGFEQFARSLQAGGRSLVLLVDEFHLLMRDEQSEVLPTEFFNYLRSLANSYAVSLIVSSHVDLYTLSIDSRLSGSPLFNILHKLHLGPFSPAEARDMIETPSALRGCSLSGDTDWIVSNGGYHPLYLQIACSTAFDWRAEHGQQGPLDIDLANRRFIEEAEPHFQGTWRLFSSSEQKVLSLIARGAEPGPDKSPIVDTLTNKGYLRQASRPVVFSDGFRDFVLRHAREGDTVHGVAAPTSARSAKARLFLSYASEDRAPVKDLYRRLENNGMDPWMDDEDLIAGDSWARKIDEAIEAADFFLACISTRSVDKKGVLRNELARGLDRWYTRAAPDNYLVPVLLEECPLPGQLSHVQKIDLWHDDGWTRLKRGLEVALERRHDSAVSEPPPGVTAPLPLTTGEPAESSDFINRARTLLERYGMWSGVALLVIGVLLLIGGLSGSALSWLIETVGLQRAKNSNIILRGLEVATLVAGGGLVCFGLLRRANWRGFTGAIALVIALVFLVNISVPAPSAFALAYGRYLDAQSAVWRQLLMNFFDQGSGGIRDGRESRTVQAWATAQTVVGILASVDYDGKKAPQEVRRSFDFLEKIRLHDTEPGWGYFAQNTAAITEVTAWVTLAEIQSVKAGLWSPEQRMIMEQRIARDLSALVARQTMAGGFSPIRDRRNENARTYSTVMVLWAMAEGLDQNMGDEAVRASATNGMDWLLEGRDRDLGWVPNPGRRYQTEEFPGLTAQVLVVLDLLQAQLPSRAHDPRLLDAQRRFTGVTFDSASIRMNARVPDSDVHVYDGDSAAILEGSSFLWYPWARAAFAQLAKDGDLDPAARNRAARQLAALTLRTEELTNYLNDGLPYQLAENLLCIHLASHPR